MTGSQKPIIVLAALGLIMLSGGADTQAADAVIKIANFTFDPPTLTVKVGSSVTWKNDDDIVHVVRENEGKFHSKPLDTNDTFSQTFTRVGEVDYFCAIHPHMTGRIVVQP